MCPFADAYSICRLIRILYLLAADKTSSYALRIRWAGPNIIICAWAISLILSCLICPRRLHLARLHSDCVLHLFRWLSASTCDAPAAALMIVIIVRNAQNGEKDGKGQGQDDEEEPAENQSIIICAALYFRVGVADGGLWPMQSSSEEIISVFDGRLDTSKRLIEGEIGPFWPNRFDR